MSRRIATSWGSQLPQLLRLHPGTASRLPAASATSYHLVANPWLPCSPSSQRRLLSASPALRKKSGKSNLSNARSDSSPPVNNAHMATPTDDAFDLSTMESSILRAMERLTHDLSELRAGGRFNPAHLEKLKVTLKPSGSALDAKEKYPLGDIALVIPKGRVVHVATGDEEYIKPLMTAIQASPYSLAPQPPTLDAPLTITVPIPPPTGESRKKALESAKTAETTALQAIQNARATHQKKLRALDVDKKVRPDDVKKAKNLMDETAKKGQDEVKKIVAGARTVFESL
ncbi:ribosome recycling factor [Diplodia corticola]|uniref:Ribosome recycling factor n=1 Tax=Diplodia corticola TaxID=236234 RepID=A0A1J9SMG6_9PEZI|nr:ribosome recycling factor [Diplodia corticola]OJD40805.1 ribosome recycling factor [Diplodia corticola]